MNRLHFLIIENLNLRRISTKSAPLLHTLILATQITLLLILKMIICCLLLSIVPFDGTITVTCYILVYFFWFPLQPRARITGESRSTANIHNFALSDIVHFNLTVTTSSSNIVVILMNLESKYLCIDITKKVNHSWLIMRVINCIERDLPRMKLFNLLFPLYVFKELIQFLPCGFLLVELSRSLIH